MANYQPKDAIEFGVRDEFPVTFDALVDSPLFGADALVRRKSLVMARIWGNQLSHEEIEILDIRVQTYVSKLIARTLIGPGIDYWANQIITQSAGTSEQVSYDAQRVVELKDADKRLVAEIAELLPDVEVILPPIKLTVGSAPHVAQAGKLETVGALDGLATPDPYDFPSPYAPLETDTTNTA